MIDQDPGSPRPLILADRGCPFTHRVLALFDHLGVEHDRREARLGQLPEGLSRWSPSGRIPLLVHGPLVIGDSRVILEYVAEAYAFDAAYPREIGPRTRQRHAMAVWDDQLAPTLTRDDATPRPARVAECLDVVADATRTTPPVPCLLAFHLAPVWLRMRWWHPAGEITRAIVERPALAAWLDAAASVDGIVRTAPSEAENVADFRAVLADRHAARG